MTEQHRSTPELHILTPSYEPDRELCRDLAESVQEFGPAGTRHTVIVPRGDIGAFRRSMPAEVEVADVRGYLPRSFRRLPRVNAWVDLRHPSLPVRGWIAQQIVKLAAAAQSPADAVLIADSDLRFVRSFALETFAPTGVVPLYRLPQAVHAGMTRHIIWDRVARRMLSVPPSTERPLPDYICWPCVWDPTAVRALLARVTEATGRPWQTSIGASRHFSEMVLYGVYVDQVEGDRRPRTTDMHCPHFSDEDELSAADLHTFLQGLGASDVAAMVSARSATALNDRRAAFRALAGRLR